MSNLRANRVADQIQIELASLIRDNLKDPRVGFVSIVRVEVAGDLRHAKVLTSVMGDAKQKKDSMKGLQNAAAFLRSELAKRMSLRYTPELHFSLDESIEHGTRIAKLLVEVQEQEATKAQQEAKAAEQQEKADQEAHGE